MQTLLDFLKSLKGEEKRPIKENITEYGRYSSRIREVMYSDNDKEYGIPITVGKNEQEVHSAKALIEFVKEELRRRKNETGKYSTIKLGIEQGTFTADDNFNEGICKYSRIYSEQLDTLNRFNNKILDHDTLIEMILRLKPSIEKDVTMDYSQIFATYSKIRIARNAKMNTTPVYSKDGIADNSYTCTFRITSGAKEGTDEDITLPEGFDVVMPFVKAGEYDCHFNIDIQPLFDPSGAPTFKIKIPNYETEIEKSIINEATNIKNALIEYPEILILADL